MRILVGVIVGLLFAGAVFANDFVLKSTAFSNNEKVPILYSCDGKDISPALAWDNAPANTKSFLLILSSPDWSTGFVNLWIVYNIPSNVKMLSEGANQNLPKGALVGTNYYYETSYRGPCPPDDFKHHYVFTIYALDTVLDLPEGAEIDDVLDKSNHHILKQTQLTGIFSH